MRLHSMSDSTPSLSAAAVQAIAQRVADRAGLQLPGNLTSRQEDDRDADGAARLQRVEYLQVTAAYWQKHRHASAAQPRQDAEEVE